MMSQDNSASWVVENLSPGDNVYPDGQDVFGSDSDEEYSVQTPEQKSGSLKVGSVDPITEALLSSSNESSDISTNNGSDSMSSSSSSSDADSGPDMPKKKHLFHLGHGGDVLQPKFMEQEDDLVDMKEYIPIPEGGEDMAMEKGLLYEELLEKVANYETELGFAKKKLQASQEEIARLKYENLTLVEELGSTIEKLQTSESNMKEMEINIRFEFQEGQDRLNEKLEIANQCIDQLQAQLDSERKHGSELQAMIGKTTRDLSDHTREVEELKLTLHNAQEKFCKDESQYQSDIAYLHEQRDDLQMRLNEAEMRQKLSEDRIEWYEVEKMETEKSHEAWKTTLQDDLYQKEELVNSLNINLDAYKLKFDTAMAEKDALLAKLEMLGAEMSCRNISIQRMEEHISRITAEHNQRVAEFEKTQKLVEELSLKVTDQEKELEKQRVSICDAGQEKREAIRQLCLSIEYYRSVYHELRLALIKHKRPAVLAS